MPATCARLSCRGGAVTLAWRDDAPRSVTAVVTDSRLDELLSQFKTLSASQRELESGALSFGMTLGRTIGNGLGELVSSQRAKSQDVVLEVQAGDSLAFNRLPWEMLAWEGDFLAVGVPCVHVVRVPDGLEVRDPSGQAPSERELSLVFMAASPRDGGALLDYENEELLIRRAVSDLPHTGIDFDVEDTGNLRQLARRVRTHGDQGCDAVHLSCHGTREQQLCLEDDYGFEVQHTVADLAHELQGAWPRLCFLSACHSAQDGFDPLEGLSLGLVAAGCPNVLGWRRAVSDYEATSCARFLYEALAEGQTVLDAVARARRSMRNAEQTMWNWAFLALSAGYRGGGALVQPGRRGARRRIVRMTDFLDKTGQRGEVAGDEVFVGRRRHLQRCLGALDQRERGKVGVMLTGLGGLGKSSLAAKLLQRMDGAVRVVMIGRFELNAFLAETLEAAGSPAALAQALPETAAQLQPWLARVLDRAADGRRLVFVFDDFEQWIDLKASTDADAVAVDGFVTHVLRALLLANAAADRPAGVIVTSRYAFTVPDDRGRDLLARSLRIESLEPMSHAELGKQARHELDQGDAPAAEDAEAENHLVQRAVERSQGNPEVLHYLVRLVRHAPEAAQEVLEHFEAKGLTSEALSSVEDQEESQRMLDLLNSLVIGRLLALMDEEGRAALARLALVQLPVPEAAWPEIGTNGTRAIQAAERIGLVDAYLTGRREDTRAAAVSALVAPHLPTLAEEDARQAVQGFLPALAQAWPRPERSAAQSFELLRLALAVDNGPLATEALEQVGHGLIRGNQYQAAAQLTERVLALGGDTYDIHHIRARALYVLDPRAALPHYERALALLERAPAPAQEAGADARDRDRAAILHNMAHVLAQQGDIPRAMELYNQSLELQEKIGNVGGKAATLHEMAGVLAQQGQVERAMALWQQSLGLIERIGDAAGKAAALHEMAHVLAQQGDIPRAMELYNQSLELQEKIGDVRGKAATLHEMAGVLAQQGQVERAMALWQQSLEIEEKIGDVAGKAATQHEMAGVLAQQGQVERALALWKESLGLKEKIGDVQGKAATLNNMAVVLAQQGQVERAMALWQQSLGLKEKIGDVRGKAATLHAMGRVLAQRGEVGRAMALWQEAREIQDKISDVQGKAVTLHEMAGVLAQQGEVARALALWQESIEIQEKIGDVADKAATLNNMAGVLAQQGEVERAMALWQESLEIEEKIGDVLGKAATLNNMAYVLAGQGEVERAMELYKQSLELKEKIGDVQGKAATLHNMAGVLAQQGEVERAMALWHESLGLKERIGDVRGKAATLLSACQIVCLDPDRGEEALTMAREGVEILRRIRSAELAKAETILEYVTRVAAHPALASSLRLIQAFERCPRAEEPGIAEEHARLVAALGPDTPPDVREEVERNQARIEGSLDPIATEADRLFNALLATQDEDERREILAAHGALLAKAGAAQHPLAGKMRQVQEMVQDGSIDAFVEITNQAKALVERFNACPEDEEPEIARELSALVEETEAAGLESVVAELRPIAAKIIERVASRTDLRETRASDSTCGPLVEMAMSLQASGKSPPEIRRIIELVREASLTQEEKELLDRVLSRGGKLHGCK